MTEWLVLLSQSAADRIVGISAGWGHLNMAVSSADRLAGIVGVGERDTLMFPTALNLPAGHPLNVADIEPRSGIWHRGDPALQTAWLDCRMRSAVLSTDGFRRLVTDGWINPPANRARFTLIYTPGETPGYSAWWVGQQEAQPADLEVSGRPDLGWAQLEPGWPVNVLRAMRVAVIGVGSIGAAAAEVLAGYGIGTLALVDPDRLLSHNLIRHPLTARDLGRTKVAGLADHLRRTWPETAVEPLALDAVVDADRIRPMLKECALVVCAADGVTPRRVVSHLARHARIPAVLACVLEDGEIGEVLRLQPWPSRGCLTCQREHLAGSGGFDPEPALDAPYGLGSDDRPMTAVAGDLHLVGTLAAKSAVATLLERAGHHDQILPGDHLLLALRPRTDLPPPADLRRTGDQRWLQVGPPVPGCPTCDPDTGPR
ncbi:hypothetical protein ABH920_002760 [Catenulispora sp. EB89]